MENKVAKGWKTTAIIFIILFFFMLSWITLGWYLIIQEEKNTNECYYDICEDYPEAAYTDPVCYCYGYDLMGEWVLEKTEYMN